MGMVAIINQSYDAKENVVILACVLPPHTSQNSTPGHQCVYNRSMKQNRSQVCHKFFQTNQESVITKHEFSILLSPTIINVTIIKYFSNAGKLCRSKTYR